MRKVITLLTGAFVLLVIVATLSTGALAAKNAGLRGQVASLEERVASLERHLSQLADDTDRQMDALVTQIINPLLAGQRQHNRDIEILCRAMQDHTGSNPCYPVHD